MTIDRLRSHLLPLLLLATATMAVYGRILGHDFIRSWDDFYYVTDNDAIKAVSLENLRAVFSSFYVGNYAPVQMLSYMLDHALWGLHAGGFLCTNLLVHLLNGLLAYRLLYRFHADMALAFCGAAVFLLHPLQVETVAWVSQRKNLLAMLFFLLAWELYCRYRQSPTQARLCYAASLAAFVLAGLSKSVVVIFPLILVWAEFFFSPGREERRWRDKLPFFAVAVLVAGLALLSQQPDNLTWGGSSGGGMSGYHGGSLFATFLTMLTVVCRYLWLILWPVDLSVLYEHTVFTAVSLRVVAAAGLLLLLVGLACLLFRQNRRYGFWPIFFLTALLPVSQIVPLVTLMNDRYLYFPMLAVAGLYGAGCATLLERFGRRGLLPVAVVLPILALLSFQRAGVWRDDISLWRDTALKSPGKAEAWQNLAVSLQRSPADYKREAIAAYERSYELAPRETTLYLLGTVYQELKEYDTALLCFQHLLERSPDNVMGLTALGNTYRLMGEYEKAELPLRRAYQLQPEAREIARFLELLRSDRTARVKATGSPLKRKAEQR